MTDLELLTAFKSRFCLPIKAAEIAGVTRGRMSQVIDAGRVETIDGYVRLASLRAWMEGRANGRPKKVH